MEETLHGCGCCRHYSVSVGRAPFVTSRVLDFLLDASYDEASDGVRSNLVDLVGRHIVTCPGRGSNQVIALSI
jgi:hypothetical protein